MDHNTFHLHVHDAKLFAQCWQPEIVKAVIVLVHGMGEHSSRYADSVVPHLIENGYAVVAYDNFGHGRTEGKRGHCPSYDILMQSVEAATHKAESLFPHTPKFLYGHSMGGNLVINIALRKDLDIKGVVATSPFLRLAFKPPKWKLFLGRTMLSIWPSMTLPSELEVEAISRDANEVRRYNEDPLVHDKISPMFTFPIMDAGEWALENVDKLRTSMLVLHGTGDRIIDHRASEELAVHNDKIQLRLFEEGYHELHHDICKVEFMQAILDWLKSKT